MAYLERLPAIKAIFLDLDGVLTDGGVYVSETGAQLRKMNIRDGYAIQLAAKMKYIIAVISGSTAESVLPRLRGLGIQEIQLGAKDKVGSLKQIMAKHNLKANEIAYMGDDVPDLAVMKAVGLAVAPSDACAEVKAVAHFITQNKGGEGCVRELIEIIMRSHEKWNNEFSALTRSI